MTRDCLDPWTYFEVDTNGDVKPCCARGSVGNLGEAHLNQILEGEPVRWLRAGLLNGTLDADCAKCPLRGPIKPAGLQQKVRGLLEEASGASKPVDSTGRAATAASVKVANLLSAALQHLREGRKSIAWTQVSQALAIDPSIKSVGLGDITIRTHLAQITADVRFPSTLTWLAAICREAGDRASAIVLMRHYLEIAPEASDRHHVLEDLKKEKRFAVQDAMRKQRTRAMSFLAVGWFKLRMALRFRTRARTIIRKLQEAQKRSL
jgi:hypothetical protein